MGMSNITDKRVSQHAISITRRCGLGTGFRSNDMSCTDHFIYVAYRMKVAGNYEKP